MPVTAQCRSCKASIEWAVSEGKRRRLPVDAVPVADGNILLRHVHRGTPPVAHVVGADERAELERQAANRGDELRLFKSHFATCPQAAEHRR